MAIAFDTSTQATSADTDLTLTWSHTCTGSNLYLVVFVSQSQGTDVSCKYNGVSMTSLAITSRGVLYGLANPATGANNIVYTRSGSPSTQGIIGLAASYTGCSSSQPDSFVSNVTGASPLTVSTTVVASNCWLIAGGIQVSTTPTSNRTDRQRASVASGRGADLSDSNGTVGTGSQSTIFTATGTTDGLAISLAPFLPVTGTFLSFFY